MILLFWHAQYINFAMFLIILTTFQEVAKFLKLNHFLRKVLRPLLNTTTLFHLSLYYQSLLKGLFMTKQMSFCVRTKFSTDFNLVFEKITLQMIVLDIWLIKLLPDSRRAFWLEWYWLIFKNHLSPLTTKFYLSFSKMV